jgi:hypothetical protein
MGSGSGGHIPNLLVYHYFSFLFLETDEWWRTVGCMHGETGVARFLHSFLYFGYHFTISATIQGERWELPPSSSICKGPWKCIGIARPPHQHYYKAQIRYHLIRKKTILVSNQTIL